MTQDWKGEDVAESTVHRMPDGSVPRNRKERRQARAWAQKLDAADNRMEHEARDTPAAAVRDGWEEAPTGEEPEGGGP